MLSKIIQHIYLVPRENNNTIDLHPRSGSAGLPAESVAEFIAYACAVGVPKDAAMGTGDVWLDFMDLHDSSRYFNVVYWLCIIY